MKTNNFKHRIRSLRLHIALRVKCVTYKASIKKTVNSPELDADYTMGMGILGFCGDWSGLGGSGIIRGWLLPIIELLRAPCGVQRPSDRIFSCKFDDARRPTRDGRAGAGEKASAPAKTVAAINKARLIIFPCAAARLMGGLIDEIHVTSFKTT
jgi:hypothetical protein